MSWTSQAENLVATGKVTSSAIFGLDGVKWGGTEGFEPIGTEIQYILNALDDEQTAVLLPKVGVTIGGKKYTYLRRDPGHSIIAKSKLGGCVISKTSKAIVIGVFKNPISVEQCVCEVERLVDYLISMQL
eukprot:m.137704 g.137704  ORF g.137704 m.137704 type:complete len:130 (-) comp13149_c0_seq14:1803-2192(-)